MKTILDWVVVLVILFICVYVIKEKFRLGYERKHMKPKPQPAPTPVEPEWMSEVRQVQYVGGAKGSFQSFVRWSALIGVTVFVFKFGFTQMPLYQRAIVVLCVVLFALRVRNGARKETKRFLMRAKAVRGQILFIRGEYEHLIDNFFSRDHRQNDPIGVHVRYKFLDKMHEEFYELSKRQLDRMNYRVGDEVTVVVDPENPDRSRLYDSLKDRIVVEGVE